MADTRSLSADLRERAGKGAARATRREGRVPAVIYGNKQDPVMISLHPVELMHQIQKGGFFNSIVEIEAGKDKHRVLPRDIQVDPVTGRPIHVDFMRFSAKTKLHVEVEVDFINDEASPGLKKGGVLNIVRHAVELVCIPDAIPEKLVIDLTGTEIGDSIHISAVKLPEGVEPAITDRDFTVATIAAPTKVAEPSEEEGEGAEGEEGEAAAAEGGDEE